MTKPARIVSSLIFISSVYLLQFPAEAIAREHCDLRLRAPVNDESGSGIAGKATVCAGDDGVAVRVNVEHLTPGFAYTVWFVYFDQPSACQTPNNCQPIDTLGTNPIGVFGRFDSVVADESGEADFSNALRDFRLSSGSHVHMAIFTHGLASENDNRFRARQLLTPQRPPLGAPGLGAPADGIVGQLAAAAIFVVP